MTFELEQHLFLSPHYDDIPLSCGGTVASLAARGHRQRIALVFGDYPDPRQPLTDFARRLHSEWGLEANKVIDARRAEETVASGLIGATDVYLPFRDAIYRGSSYVSDQDLFAAPVEQEVDLPRQITASLDIPPPGESAPIIYAPLGIGGHVDHQLTFTTGQLLSDAGYVVRFYEDLPYALSPDFFASRMDAIDELIVAAESVPVEDVWEIKIDAIMAYPSQVAVIFHRYLGVEPSREGVSDAMLKYAMAAGDGVVVERFWKLTGA